MVHYMVSLKNLLADAAKAIVDYPDEVTVTETEESDGVLLVLSVAPTDMGKVIGKHGKIARALRTLVKASANSIGKKVTVEIR